MDSKYRLVFAATSEWLEIAEGQGLVVDREAEFPWNTIEAVAQQLGDEEGIIQCLDQGDEVALAELTRPRDCDTILSPGDLVLMTGTGGHVYFVRQQVKQLGERR